MGATGTPGSGGASSTGGSGGSDTGGSGGSDTGGSGGISSTGGSGNAEPTLAEQYPCDGSTDGYDAVVSGSGSNWTTTTANGSQNHNSMLDAITAAFNAVSGNASNKAKVLVQDSGDVPADIQLRIPSYTVFNVCGTINVVGAISGSDRSPCYARGRTDIDIPHLAVTGGPQYACFFRETNNVHLGVVDIRLNNNGLGIRADNNPQGNNWENSSRNDRRNRGFRIDEIYVQGTSMGVEFYGIEDITIGTVVARNTSEAGLMLNNSRYAEVGLVDGQGVSPNAGYAVFRMANDNGRNWDDNDNTHPFTIHVGKVIARSSGGPDGRGIFCLTRSGGVVIDEIDIEGTANHSIYLQECTNVVIGNPNTQSRVHASGAILLRPPSANITFENLAITSTNLTIDQDCPANLVWKNVTHNGTPVTTCQ